MPGFVHFLRCVGKAVVKNGGKALAGLVPFGAVAAEVAKHAWEEYRKDRSEAQLRAELQDLARASPAEVRLAAEEVVAGQPSEVREALSAYLTQMPAAIRQSLRRPSDPGGTTVSPVLALKTPEDLLPVLPANLPRFKPGDRPLEDWELVELLGKGGFGEVWKARHLTRSSQKPVALKFCLDPVAAATLRNEATLPLRFACVDGWYWESAGDFFIQVMWQTPEIQEAFLHVRQRRQQHVALSVDLDDADTDRLHRPQQQLGAGSRRVAALLAGVDLLQLRTLRPQSFAHHPLHR